MIIGMFKLSPSLPKYVVTYDLDSILQYMDSLPANNVLSINLLAEKVCTLLCLLSGQRSQTISSLKVDRSVLANRTHTEWNIYNSKNSKAREISNPFGFPVI